MKKKTITAVALTITCGGLLAVTIDHTLETAPPSAIVAAPRPSTAPLPAPNANDTVQPPVAGQDQPATGVDALISGLDRMGPEAPIYAAIHQEFPERYVAIVAQMRMAEGPNATGGLSALAQSTLLDIRAMVPQSSDTSLRKVAAAQYALLGALENESPKTCAGYISGAGLTALPDDDTVQDIATLLSVAQIHAAGEAKRNPVVRPAPSHDLYVQLAERMRARGASADQIAAMGDGGLASLAPVDQCRLVRTMYHATLDMTPEDAGGIIAGLSNH